METLPKLSAEPVRFPTKLDAQPGQSNPSVDPTVSIIMPDSMKCRSSFLASVALSFAALVLIQAARHQLALALRSCGTETLFEHFQQRGAFLLYSAWVFAFGSAESLWQSHRSREPESSWPVIVLLGVFLYLGVVP